MFQQITVSGIQRNRSARNSDDMTSFCSRATGGGVTTIDHVTSVDQFQTVANNNSKNSNTHVVNKNNNMNNENHHHHQFHHQKFHHNSHSIFNSSNMNNIINRNEFKPVDKLAHKLGETVGGLPPRPPPTLPLHSQNYLQPANSVHMGDITRRDISPISRGRRQPENNNNCNQLVNKQTQPPLSPPPLWSPKTQQDFSNNNQRGSVSSTYNNHHFHLTKSSRNEHQIFTLIPNGSALQNNLDLSTSNNTNSISNWQRQSNSRNSQNRHRHRSSSPFRHSPVSNLSKAELNMFPAVRLNEHLTVATNMNDGIQANTAHNLLYELTHDFRKSSDPNGAFANPDQQLSTSTTSYTARTGNSNTAGAIFNRATEPFCRTADEQDEEEALSDQLTRSLNCSVDSSAAQTSGNPLPHLRGVATEFSPLVRKCFGDQHLIEHVSPVDKHEGTHLEINI